MKHPTPFEAAPTRRKFLESIFAGGTALTLAGCENEPLFNPVYPKGPALMYTAWPGVACGTTHDFANLTKASEELGIPLYVVNSLPDLGTIGADKPHDTEIPVKDNKQSNIVLSHYNLAFTDARVRLIDVDGNVVPTPDITSKDDIVDTFKPFMAKARVSQAAAQARTP